MKFTGVYVAFALASSVAAAHGQEFASDEAAGRIAAVDPSTLVLEDGATFVIGEGLSTRGLAPGIEVTVLFEEKDGDIVAKKVAPSGGMVLRLGRYEYSGASY